jgi:hypothetical protein
VDRLERQPLEVQRDADAVRRRALEEVVQAHEALRSGVVTRPEIAPRVTFLRLLRARPLFAVFLLSEAISLGGDWFGVVAVSVLALEQGRGDGAGSRWA